MSWRGGRTNFNTSPENALAKAANLVKVGQCDAAIDTLHTILNSKKYRTWTPTHEQIIALYIDLAIKQRKSMRDALVKYRNICQGDHPKKETSHQSLENMIQRYEDKCKERALLARKEAEEKNASTEANTVVEESAENLMLQAVSGETSQDRTDQALLTPWVEYLWEAYLAILQVLRNNARLLPMYQAVARRGFEFCLEFKRPSEFRRLCGMLRTHLGTIAKYQNQTNSVELESIETQKLYLETRFAQLEKASQLELWQEAYRTIEDISANMRLTQETPSPALMKTYYEKLSQIFWASQNHLFHAYSLSEFYMLSAANDAMEPAAKEELASAVLLAILAVPPVMRYRETENLLNAENEENLRLANLLGFKKETPTRTRLMERLFRHGLLQEVSAEAREFYDLSEVKFGPLKLRRNTEAIFAALEKSGDVKAAGLPKDKQTDPFNVAKYVGSLKRLVALRVLQQLGTIFKSMRLEKFKNLIPDMDFDIAERIILEAAKSGQINIQVDHRAGLLLFYDEGMQATWMKNQLSVLSKQLGNIVKTIAPPVNKSQEREHVCSKVLAGVKEEHAAVFARIEEIELRKQKEENEALERKKQKEEQNKKNKEAHAELEKKRRKEEDEARHRRREIRLANEVKEKEKQDLLEKVAASKIKAKKNLETQNKDELARLLMEAQKKEALEVTRKLKEKSRKQDYLVRAIRLEEMEPIRANADALKERNRETFEKNYAIAAAKAKREHDKNVADKARLARMVDQIAVFREQTMAARQQAYDDLEAAQLVRLRKRKAQRAAAEEREKEQKAAEEAQAKLLEEEQAKRAEEAKRINEEQAAAEAKLRAEEEAERATRTAAKAAKIAKLDAAAKKRQQREEELQKRQEERIRERAGASAGPSAPASGGSRFGGLRGDAAPSARFGNNRSGPPGGADIPPADTRDRFGGADRGGGSNRFGGDRPRGSRFGGDGDRGGRFGGDGDRGGRFGGDGGRGGRFGGDRGDRDGGDRPRFGGGGRDGGDRPRFGGGGGGRDGGDRPRFGGRDGDDRRGGGERDGGDRSNFGGGTDERADGARAWRRTSAPTSRAAPQQAAPARFGGGERSGAGGGGDRPRFGSKTDNAPDRAAERNAINRDLAPRAAPSKAPVEDDDGFTTVKKKRR